jgi:hypothetical protein
LASFALLAVRLSKSTAGMCLNSQCNRRKSRQTKSTARIRLYSRCNRRKSRQTKSTARIRLHYKWRRGNSRRTTIPTNSIDTGQSSLCRLATRFSMQTCKRERYQEEDVSFGKLCIARCEIIQVYSKDVPLLTLQLWEISPDQGYSKDVPSLQM